VVAVPPTKFTLDLDTAVRESIGDRLEGKIDQTAGVLLAVTEIESIDEGRILPGDPAVHYPARFKVLAWMPREHEVVEGEVVDITEFGAFVQVGALDALVHVSQVMDDFVSYDEKNSQLVGRQSHRVLKVGDAVRARIISISFKEQSKVGLTMRQPFLGSLKWLSEKPKEEKKAPEKKEKKE
jgi:DNA-directed RNA polymerase subunit E'